MPIQPGTTLGPYSVTAKIGEGGMGLVRRLRHRADTLGFALVSRETGEILEGTVS